MTSTMDEQAFIDAFEACSLAPEAFRHRDHVRLAWLYLHRYTVPVALGRYSEGLKRFALVHGKDGLYNETITYAFVFLIHERIEQAEGEESWTVFVRNNPDLFTEGVGLLHTYYYPETLKTPRARRIFVMPDRVLEKL